MRTLLLVVVLGAAGAFVSAQTAEAPRLNFLAETVREQGSALQLHGRVRIAACAVLTAEDAVLNVAAGEADLSGPVHMTLTHGVDRLAIGK